MSVECVCVSVCLSVCPTAAVLTSQAEVIVDRRRTWPPLTSLTCRPIADHVLMGAGFSYYRPTWFHEICAYANMQLTSPTSSAYVMQDDGC